MLMLDSGFRSLAASDKMFESWNILPSNDEEKNAVESSSGPRARDRRPGLAFGLPRTIRVGWLGLWIIGPGLNLSYHELSRPDDSESLEGFLEPHCVFISIKYLAGCHIKGP